MQQPEEGVPASTVVQATAAVSVIPPTTAGTAPPPELPASGSTTTTTAIEGHFSNVTSLHLQQQRRPHTSHASTRIANTNPLLLPPSHRPLPPSSALAHLKQERGGYWQFAAGGLAFHPSNLEVRADPQKRARMEEIHTRSGRMAEQRRRREQDELISLSTRGRSMSPPSHVSLLEQQTMVDAGSTPNSGFHVGLPQAYPARVHTSAGMRMTDRRDFTQTDLDQVSRRSAKGMHFMMNNNSAAAQGFKEERVKGLPKEAGAAPTVTHLLNSVFHSSLLPPHSHSYHLQSPDPIPAIEPKRERTVQELIADDDRLRREETLRHMDQEAHGRLTANGGRLPHAASLARSDSSRIRPSRQHKRQDRKPFADIQHHTQAEINHATNTKSEVDWSHRSRQIQAFLETDYTLPILMNPKSAALSANQFNPSLEPFRHTHTTDSQRAKNQFQYAAPSMTVNISPSIAVNTIPHPRGFDPAVRALPKAFHDSNTRVLQQGMESDKLKQIEQSQQQEKGMLVPDAMKPMFNPDQLKQLDASIGRSSDKLSGRLSLLEEYLKNDVTSIVDAHKPQSIQAFSLATKPSTALVVQTETGIVPATYAQWPPPFHSPFFPPQLDHAYYDYLREKQSSQSARVHRPMRQQPANQSVFHMSWEEEKAEPMLPLKESSSHHSNHSNPLQPPVELVSEIIPHSHVDSTDEQACNSHCSHAQYTHRSASPQPSLDPLSSAEMGSSLWSYMSGPFEKNLFKQRGRSRGIYSSQSRRKKIEETSGVSADEQKEPYSAAQQAADRVLQSQRSGARSPTRICKTTRAIDAAASVHADYQHRIARSRLGSRAGARSSVSTGSDFQSPDAAVALDSQTQFDEDGGMKVVVDDVSSSEPTFDADGYMTVVVPSGGTQAIDSPLEATDAPEVDPDAEIEPDAHVDLDAVATVAHVVENHSVVKQQRIGSDMLHIPLTTLSKTLSVEGSLVVPGMKLSQRPRSVSPGASLRSSSNSSPSHSPTRSRSKSRNSSTASPTNMHVRHNSTAMSRSGASSRAGHSRSASHAVMSEYHRARSAGATRGGSKGDLASMLRQELAMSGFEHLPREQQDESISQWVTDAMTDAESNVGPTHSVSESAAASDGATAASVEEDLSAISVAHAEALEAARIEAEAAKRAEAADLALHAFVSPSMHAVSPTWKMRAGIKKHPKSHKPVQMSVLPPTGPPAASEVNEGPKKWSKRKPKRPADNEGATVESKEFIEPTTTLKAINKVETEPSSSLHAEFIGPSEIGNSLFTPQSSDETTSIAPLQYPESFPATSVSSTAEQPLVPATQASSAPETAQVTTEAFVNELPPAGGRSRPTSKRVTIPNESSRRASLLSGGLNIQPPSAASDKNLIAKSAASPRSTSPESSGRSGAPQQTRSKPSSRSVSRRGSLSTAQAIAMAQRVLMDEVGAALTKRLSMGRNTKIDIPPVPSKRRSLVDSSPIETAKTPLTRPPSHTTSRRPSLAAAGAAVALAAGIDTVSTANIPSSRSASRRQSRRSSSSQDSDLSAIQAQLNPPTNTEKSEAAATPQIEAVSSTEQPNAHLRTSSMPLPRPPPLAPDAPSVDPDDGFDADELLSPSDSTPAPSPFTRAVSVPQSPTFRPLDAPASPSAAASPSSRRSTISKLDDKELEEIRQRRAAAKEKRMLKRMSQAQSTDSTASSSATDAVPAETPASPLHLSGMSHEEALAAGLIAGTIQAELAALHSDVVDTPSEISDSAESSPSSKTSPALRPVHRRTSSSQRRSVTAAPTSPRENGSLAKKKRKSRRTLSHQDAMQFVVSDDEETEIKEEEKVSSDDETTSIKPVATADTENVAKSANVSPTESFAFATAPPAPEPNSSASIALVGILKTKLGKAARKSIAAAAGSASPSSNPSSPRGAARASLRKSVVFGKVDVASSPKLLKEKQLSTAPGSPALQNNGSTRSPALLRGKTMDSVGANSRSPVTIRRAVSIASSRASKVKAKASKGKSDNSANSSSAAENDEQQAGAEAGVDEAPEQEIDTIDYVPTALTFVPRPPSPLRSMTPPNAPTPPRSETPSTPRSLAARRAKLTHRASVLFKEQKRQLEEMAQDERDRAGYAPLVPKPPRSQQTSDSSTMHAEASSVPDTSTHADAAVGIELPIIPVISEELVASLPAIPVGTSDETLRSQVSAEIDQAVMEALKAATPTASAEPSTTAAEVTDTITISVIPVADTVLTEDGVSVSNLPDSDASKLAANETGDSASPSDVLTTPQTRPRGASKQRRMSHKRSSQATSALAKQGSATNSPSTLKRRSLSPHHKKRRQSRKSAKHAAVEAVVEESTSAGDSVSPAAAIEVGTGEMVSGATLPPSPRSNPASSSNSLAAIPRSLNATPSVPRVLLSPYDAQRAAAQAKLIAEAEKMCKRAEEAAAAGMSLELFDAESASAASAIMGPKVIEMLVEEHNSDSSAASSRATTPAYMASFTYQRGGPRTPGSSRPRHRKNHHSISSNATGDSDNSISLSIDLSEDVVLQSILNIK